MNQNACKKGKSSVIPSSGIRNGSRIAVVRFPKSVYKASDAVFPPIMAAITVADIAVGAITQMNIASAVSGLKGTITKKQIRLIMICNVIRTICILLNLISRRDKPQYVTKIIENRSAGIRKDNGSSIL